jgi:hypothetical protein
MAEPAPETEQPTKPLPESVQKGLSSSVKYLSGNFLREKHYSKISASLANRWDKFQSLTAAMKLMEQHGVHLSPEEEQRISSMTETQMIETLVAKMPQQSKEQFQHFFLQLQLIVSTATRVRTALEQGRADLVEQAMEDADSTGIAQYILKMAIVQAGSEVTNLKKQHAAWVKDAESKMSRLVRGQEDAALAKSRLAKAHAELSMFQANANEGIKKVLMAMAGGSATALLHGCLSSWHNYVKKMKIENAIYEEYREQIEAAEARLIDAKAGQLKSVRGMIEKKHNGMTVSLIQEVFTLWSDDILEAKLNLSQAGEVAAMEARLKACADHQSANAKKVLARCGAASEKGLRDMCFHEWCTFHQEYMKNKEMEDAVKAEEKKIAEFMKTHSENAKGLLNSMHAATNTGLLHEVLTAWYEIYKEEKLIAEHAEKLSMKNSKFGAFGDRNKKGAKSVMERAHEHNIMMLYLKVWGAWRLDFQVEKVLRKHQNRIDGKRQQLVSVQQMFRNFAKQLESNIQAGNDDVDLKLGAGEFGPANPGFLQKRASCPPMSRKNDGAVSLPDIHSKPGSSGRQ